MNIPHLLKLPPLLLTMSDIYLIDILIVGDSRTRNLEAKVNNASLKLRFTVITLPGANLKSIMLNTLKLSYPNTYQLIIIAGGINNLTRLLHNPSQHAVPRSGSVVDLVENTLSAMRIAVDNIVAITTKLSWHHCLAWIWLRTHLTIAICSHPFKLLSIVRLLA